MHTVGEAQGFRPAAYDAGMTDDEVEAIISYLAMNPEAGQVIPGTGGCRKLRWARPGGGKSGGYRVVTFFTGPDIPVWLITAFAKNEKANLTKAERNTLAGLTKGIAEAYRARVVSAKRANR